MPCRASAWPIACARAADGRRARNPGRADAALRAEVDRCAGRTLGDVFRAGLARRQRLPQRRRPPGLQAGVPQRHRPAGNDDARPHRPAGVVLRPAGRRRGRPRRRLRHRLDGRHRPAFQSGRQVREQPARAAPFQPQCGPGQDQCARPLRPGRRVLQAVARRPAADVHLRLLERRHAHAGAGAAQQDRPCVPQDPPGAGRALRRHRLRLRRLHVARHETRGAVGTGINTTPEQVRVAAAPRSPGAAWPARCRCGGRFPRGGRPLRQGGVDRRARACRARPAGRGHRARMPPA